MFDLKELDSEKLRNKKYKFAYTTPGYYDLVREDLTFRFVYKEFEEIQTKGFEDTLVEKWLECPVLYGAYADGEMIGLVEGSIESWNNRFRISNLLVFEGHRHKGIGSALLQHIISVAKEKKARMVVLETQTCNINAINCYFKNGFQIIGFDTHSYSNEDIEKHEMRLELGLVI